MQGSLSLGIPALLRPYQTTDAGSDLAHGAAERQLIAKEGIVCSSQFSSTSAFAQVAWHLSNIVSISQIIRYIRICLMLI